MKRFYITFSFLLFSIIIHCQDDCSDVIYPSGLRNVIYNCCIYHISNGNVVYFVKGGDSSLVVATKIKQGGVERSLRENKRQDESEVPIIVPYKPEVSAKDFEGIDYKGKSYEDYKDSFNRARNRKRFGAFLSFAGPVCILVGYSLYNGSGNNRTATILGRVGLITMLVGIPIWISGGVSQRKSRKAMEEIEQKSDLSIGLGEHGLSIAFKF